MAANDRDIVGSGEMLRKYPRIFALITLYSGSEWTAKHAIHDYKWWRCFGTVNASNPRPDLMIKAAFALRHAHIEIKCGWCEGSGYTWARPFTEPTRCSCTHCHGTGRITT